VCRCSVSYVGCLAIAVPLWLFASVSRFRRFCRCLFVSYQTGVIVAARSCRTLLRRYCTPRLCARFAVATVLFAHAGRFVSFVVGRFTVATVLARIATMLAWTSRFRCSARSRRLVAATAPLLCVTRFQTVFLLAALAVDVLARDLTFRRRSLPDSPCYPGWVTRRAPSDLWFDAGWFVPFAFLRDHGTACRAFLTRRLERWCSVCGVVQRPPLYDLVVEGGG